MVMLDFICKSSAELQRTENSEKFKMKYPRRELNQQPLAFQPDTYTAWPLG